jgi:hypothetical protein
MGKKIDLTGQHFGRLLVIEEAQERIGPFVAWVCKCDCGKQTIVRGTTLRNGSTRSCGCWAREQARRANRKHGCAGKTPEYLAWVTLKQRCLNRNHPRYPDWGGRGIRVCARYAAAFDNFIADVGRKPTPASAYSIDRKNNNGHYSCGKCSQCLTNGWDMNVRWAMRDVQGHNQRSCKGASSKYKGVVFRKDTGRWSASITREKKKYHLGHYDKEEDAAFAYNQAAKELYGEYAALNVIDRADSLQPAA